MVTITCKACNIPFDFRGGTQMCSEACRLRWPRIRANVYQVLVKPARDHPDLEQSRVHSGEITRQDFQVAADNLRDARSSYAAFLATPDPIGWIIENLPDSENKILGDS